MTPPLGKGRAAFLVTCPTCSAPPDNPCVTSSGKRTWTPHAWRVRRGAVFLSLVAERYRSQDLGE